LKEGGKKHGALLHNQQVGKRISQERKKKNGDFHINHPEGEEKKKKSIYFAPRKEKRRRINGSFQERRKSNKRSMMHGRERGSASHGERGGSAEKTRRFF